MGIERRGSLQGAGKSMAIVVSRFSPIIAKELLAGALACLEAHGVDAGGVEVAWVPGCFEIPLAARACAESGRFDAVIGLGCIIRGQTSHHEHVAREAASGLARVGHDTGVPCAFGVVTANSPEQAMERAGIKSDGRGWDAALSALEMSNLLQDLRGSGRRSRAGKK